MVAMAQSPQLAGLPTGGARQSLVDIAYEALRDAITSGTLLPGTRLREAALARHFAISTTPIREALRRVGLQGPVRPSPKPGGAVAAFHLRAILGLFGIGEVPGWRAGGRRGRPRPRGPARAPADLPAAGPR